jgi:hypothetical protein
LTSSVWPGRNATASTMRVAVSRGVGKPAASSNDTFRGFGAHAVNTAYSA